ncbi:MAG: Type IV secretion system protein VirB6 [Parcubacteria group bacterium GW2011_GWC1_38_22]|nr:MAG: Type IV secretion system protein VirB6 [Parcubacteria group bacterium GW2011_GWC1_38_22]
MNRTAKNKNNPGEIAQGGHFMKRKNISQVNYAKALLVVLFLVFGFSMFFSSPNAARALENKSACETPGNGGTWNASTGTCSCTDLNGEKRASDVAGRCAFITVTNGGLTGNAYENDGGSAGAAAYLPGAGEKTKSCGTDDIFMCTFKTLLMGIFNLCGWLFAIASTLFAWVIDPASVSGANGMLNKQAVKDVWIMVRDLLNMTFILILLFAAFCTIFQVDKWNLKKVWLNILINSLLVNFSFPIARFILLAPGNYSDYSVAYLVAMIVVVFIMGMTLMVIAGLFVVRLVALTMLVMFSPIGFVGYIFPATSNYADKWWTQLFSYSFFAPIMIFIMAISLRIMEALKQENFQPFISNANVNAGADQATWIANAAFYIIPIIILWMGIGVAKSSGIAGADTVVGAVKKGGKWLANAPGHYSGVYGGAKLGWENYKKSGPLGSNAVEMRSARIGRMLGDRNALNNVQSKRIKESSEKYDMANMTENELRDMRGSGTDRAAAMVELASRNRTTGTAELDAVRNEFGENSQVFRKLQAKVKTYDPASAFAHLDPADRQARIAEFVNSNQFDAKKLVGGALRVTDAAGNPDPVARARNAEMLNIAFQQGAINSGDVEEIRKKNPAGVSALLGDVAIATNAAGGNVFNNMATYEHREAQMAHLAQTGTFSAVVNGNRPAIQAILRESNENTLKRMRDTVFAGNPHFLEDFEQQIPQSKLSKILPALAEGANSATVAQPIIDYLRRPGGRHAAYLAANPNLAGLLMP